MHGHRAARIDPLDLMQREDVAALPPARYGLADPDAAYDVDGILWTRPIGPEGAGAERWTLKDIERRLRAVYVGRVAYEFMHSHSKTERLWFAHLLEGAAEEDVRGEWDAQKQQRVHALLARSEIFDRFLQTKFPNLKRYGLEGGESMLPALDALFRAAAVGAYPSTYMHLLNRANACIYGQRVSSRSSSRCRIAVGSTSSRTFSHTRPPLSSTKSRGTAKSRKSSAQRGT